MKKALLIGAALLAILALACESTGGGAAAGGGGGAAAANEPITLPGGKARVSGNEIRIDELGRIAYWSSRSDEVKWVDVVIPADGDYTVTCKMASANESEVEFSIEDQKVPFVVPMTGAWSADRTVDVGTMKLKKGTYTAYLKATKLTGSYVGNIYKIMLTKK